MKTTDSRAFFSQKQFLVIASVCAACFTSPLVSATQAADARKNLPEDTGNWGLSSGGFRLSLEFDKLTYFVGERVECRGILQNTTDRDLMVYVGTIIPDWTIVVLRNGKEQLPVELDSDWTVSFGDGPRTVKGGSSYTTALRLDTHFDLSKVGNYLIYAKRRIPSSEPKSIKVPINSADPNDPVELSILRVDADGEVTSGNVLINIVAAAPEKPGETGKPIVSANQSNVAPAKIKGSSGQPAVSGASSVGHQSKTATPAARADSTSGSRPDNATVQKGNAASAASGTPGTQPRETVLTRTTVTAFLFALLGFGVLWWMFRGK